MTVVGLDGGCYRQSPQRRCDYNLSQVISYVKTGSVETVIFIPNTPGSVLKKRYMEEVGKSE